MTITEEEYKMYFEPASGETVRYYYTHFDIRGVPEERYVTLPAIPPLGPGPFRIKKREEP